MPGRILIADDVATNRIVLKVKLTAAFYDVLQAESGRAALEMARAESPDLILLDLKMADQDGVSLCEALKADPKTADIPVLILTAMNDREAKYRALRAGADDFLSKPLDELTLLARVRSLLRARDTAEELRLRDHTHRALGLAEPAAQFEQPAHVALIAARLDTAQTWKEGLQGRLPGTIEVLSKEDALALTPDGTPPDVYVVALNLATPDDGLRLLSELRSRATSRHAAIVVVLPEGAGEKAATALDMGANDLMIEGFDAEELALRLRAQIKRKREADRLRETLRDGLRMAVTDPLTGLYNRRYALPHLDRIAARAAETGRQFAVMLLDLDKFKAVNDTHGHATGDAVLCTVGELLKNNLRAVDLVARIGGEEFLIAMPDTGLQEAWIAAERLCRVVHETPVPLADASGELHVSMSIGLAMGGGRFSADAETVLSQADEALYGAKSEGRNQVTVSRFAA